MLSIKLFGCVNDFAREFERCCREYRSLRIASAWCGDPRMVLPYSHLESFKGSIEATIGRSFNHTHPGGIEFFLRLKADLRISKENADFFHPKVYLFSNAHRFAIFIGSSNLTYSGFYSNLEANILLEGVPQKDERIQILQLETRMTEWHSPSQSFVPQEDWIRSYRKTFERDRAAERRHGIVSSARREAANPSASWLQIATWETYYRRVLQGLRHTGRSASKYIDILTIARDKLPMPWRVEYFDDLELRRIIGGMKPYGWLGHVAASGKFRNLMAKAPKRRQQIMVESFNEIAGLALPLDWNRFGKLLRRLAQLGPTMKVWGRILCLVRPEVFCTVASPSVRANLSAILSLSQQRFENVDGYIELLKFMHASPWFRSAKPKDPAQLAIWTSRAAFLDAIVYSK